MSEFANMVMECVRTGHDQQIPPKAVALLLIGMGERFTREKGEAASLRLLADPFAQSNQSPAPPNP